MIHRDSISHIAVGGSGKLPEATINVETGSMFDETISENSADVSDEDLVNGDLDSEGMIVLQEQYQDESDYRLSTSSLDEVPEVISMNSAETVSAEDDYDRMFLLSLLPTMRRIPEEYKLDIKIQLQQTLAHAVRNVEAAKDRGHS